METGTCTPKTAVGKYYFNLQHLRERVTSALAGFRGGPSILVELANFEKKTLEQPSLLKQSEGYFS